MKQSDAFRLLVFGSREWTKIRPIQREILKFKQVYYPRLIIIEGGAPGADTLARQAGELNNIHVAEVRALWDIRHKSAGTQRNTAMLWLMPDKAIGFHENIRKSRGSKNMVEQLLQHGIPHMVYKR